MSHQKRKELKHFIICLKEVNGKPVDEKMVMDGLKAKMDLQLTAVLLSKVIKDYLVFQKGEGASQLEKFFNISEEVKAEVEKKHPKDRIDRTRDTTTAKYIKDPNPQSPENSFINALKGNWDLLISKRYNKRKKRGDKKLLGDFRKEVNRLLKKELKKADFYDKLESKLKEDDSLNFLSFLRSELPRLLTPRILKEIRRRKDNPIFKSQIIKRLIKNLQKSEENRLLSLGKKWEENPGAGVILDFIDMWEQIVSIDLYDDREKVKNGQFVPTLEPLFSNGKLNEYQKLEQKDDNSQAFNSRKKREELYGMLSEEEDHEPIRALYRMCVLTLESNLNHKVLKGMIEEVEDGSHGNLIEFADIDEHQSFHASLPVKSLRELLRNRGALKWINGERKPWEKQEEKEDAAPRGITPHSDTMQEESKTSEEREVVIAVLDSGIDFNHELVKNNPMFLPGEEYSEDEQQKHGDLVDASCKAQEDPRREAFGFDPEVVTEKEKYQGQPEKKGYGHGTHVAGIISNFYHELGGNPEYPKVKIKPYKVFPLARKCDIIRAMADAANDNRVKVINNSWGPPRRRTKSPALDCVIKYIETQRKNLSIVFSAGNSNDDISFYVPAKFKNVITVGAVNNAGKKAQFSNFGEGVDIYAPGQYIWSLKAGELTEDDEVIYNELIKSDSGTSMAAPFVSTVIAMIYSQYGINWGTEQIKDILQETGEKFEIRRGRFKETGHLLNAKRALKEAVPALQRATAKKKAVV